MTRPSQDDWAFRLITDVAERSTCIRRKAGALGLDEWGRIIGMGYNGVPRTFPHCIDKPCQGALDIPGDTTRCEAVHAEVNMILNSHSPYDIIQVYVSVTPCHACALVLANLPNLLNVHALRAYADESGIELLRRRGVGVYIRAERTAPI